MTNNNESAKKMPAMKVIIKEDPDFRRLPVSGVFGALNPLEGRIGFFLDSPVPKIKDGSSGEMELREIERRLMVETCMSPQIFIQISEWMNQRVEVLKKDCPELFEAEEE